MAASARPQACVRSIRETRLKRPRLHRLQLHAHAHAHAHVHVHVHFTGEKKCVSNKFSYFTRKNPEHHTPRHLSLH